MQGQPTWLKPVAVVAALLVAGILVGGVLMVPYRSMKAPEGYDQPRIHWNTKNSTRFVGTGAGEVAALVSQAVYPATQPGNQPAASEQTRTREQGDRMQRDGELSQMQVMAQKNEEQRTAPLPQAEPPAILPFPPLVAGGLWIGVLAGALLGLIWGVLLRNQIIVLPGAEGLFSMAPFAFEYFWIIAGAALGIVLAGIVTLVVLPPPAAREKKRQ